MNWLTSEEKIPEHASAAVHLGVELDGAIREVRGAKIRGRIERQQLSDMRLCKSGQIFSDEVIRFVRRCNVCRRKEDGIVVGPADYRGDIRKSVLGYECRGRGGNEIAIHDGQPVIPIVAGRAGRVSNELSL